MIWISLNYQPLQANWLLKYTFNIKGKFLWGCTFISHLRRYTLLPDNTCFSPNPVTTWLPPGFLRFSHHGRLEVNSHLKTSHFLHLSQYSKHSYITCFHRIQSLRTALDSKLQLKIALDLVFSHLWSVAHFEWLFHLFAVSNSDYLRQGCIWIPQWYLGAAVVYGPLSHVWHSHTLRVCTIENDIRDPGTGFKLL